MDVYRTDRIRNVVLLGHGGAGKTTLLRILATLMAPDAGSVRIDGHDAFLTPLRYRRELGYLQEMPALYEDMSVKAFLNYRREPLDIRGILNTLPSNHGPPKFETP